MPECSVVDLSHWNTVTDFNAIKASGVVGVIHKFSQGTSYRDPQYQPRQLPARAAGLLWGRYHFGDASDVADQVDHFLYGWSYGELLALDWEDNQGNQMLLFQARNFVQRVLDATGVLPVLYSGNTLKQALAVSGAQPGILTQCRLWLPQYGPAPVCPPGWVEPWLWQYTDKGRVDGVQGDVDCNYFAGALDELVASWDPSQPEPVPVPVPEEEITTVTLSWPSSVPVTVQVSGDVKITRV